MSETATEPRQRPTLATRRKIREAYIKGEGTLRALARRFKVSFWTIQDWATAEDWTDLRAAFDKASQDKFLAQVQPMAVPPPAIPSNDTTEAGKLARVEKQLTRVYQMLETCDPKEVKSLVESEQRLFDCWALLTGFPKPGTRKYSRRTGCAPRPQFIPVPVADEPDETGPAETDPAGTGA